MVHWIEGKKLAAEIEKVGVLFESKKIKDAQLPGFISSYLKRRSVEIEPKASEMMAEFVGADLSRMAGELEKFNYHTSKRTKADYSRTDRT